MSPERNHHHVRTRGFPRVSGDEPSILHDGDEDAEFSPRERG